MRTLTKFALLPLLIATLLVLTPAGAETRVALVIGNSNYTNAPRLANPQNDARIVADALRRVGFKSVSLVYDLNKVGMEAALKAFFREAQGADAAVVYFAGHGIEVAGVNYLVPVDATLADAGDVQFETVPLSVVLHATEGATQLKLVVLDACRNNPFAVRMKGSEFRAVGRGLARVSDSELETDMLVAYAAKAGSSANDDSGYAKALARAIAMPGTDVLRVFGNIRDDVMEASHNLQEPMIYGSLGGHPFYFVPPVSALSPAANPPKAGKAVFSIEVQQAVDAANRARVTDYVGRYLPGLVPEPYAETTCLFTNTPTEDFIIDRAENITVLSPCSGHGAKFAPLLGRLAADLATGIGRVPELFSLRAATRASFSVSPFTT